MAEAGFEVLIGDTSDLFEQLLRQHAGHLLDRHMRGDGHGAQLGAGKHHYRIYLVTDLLLGKRTEELGVAGMLEACFIQNAFLDRGGDDGFRRAVKNGCVARSIASITAFAFSTWSSPGSSVMEFLSGTTGSLRGKMSKASSILHVWIGTDRPKSWARFARRSGSPKTTKGGKTFLFAHEPRFENDFGADTAGSPMDRARISEVEGISVPDYLKCARRTTGNTA